MRFRPTGAFAALLICSAMTVARAESEIIALLPLDAEPRLEVFGQPVASEISRALIADKLDVVVVGAKMAVPPNVTLIVDGALLAKGDTIILQVRVRYAKDGITLDTLEEPAVNLIAVEKASIKLSGRLLPVVRARLAALRKIGHVPEKQPVVVPMRVDPILLVGIAVPDGASPLVEPLRYALANSVNIWVRASQRMPSPVDASTLGRQLAPQTVTTAHAERAVVFEILDYTIVPQQVALARARVRVRIADAQKVVFDRVISTDTIVGDRKMTGEALAARVAREVLVILRPHMKRLEPTWR